MTDLQQKLLEMLLEIDEICRRNDIEYYLDGGSVLGAIRHGGFIPWDDDVDIVMTRPNWEKFLVVLEKEQPKNRHLDTPQNNPLYPTTSMRFSDTGTTSLFRSLMMDVCTGGICVDLFVLEAFPRDKEKQKQYLADLSAYIEYLQTYYVVRENCNSKDYAENVKRAKKEGRDKVLADLAKRIDSYDQWEDCDQYIIRWGGNGPQIYDKTLFGKPKYVPFENVMLPVPENTKAYLRTHFGEDWYVEPEEKTHPHDCAVNMDISSSQYVADYGQFINFEKARKFFANVKVKRMKQKAGKLEFQNFTYFQSAEAFAAQLTGKCTDEVLSKLDAAIANQDHLELQNFFGEYIYKQTHGDLIYYDVFIDIPDVILRYPLYLLLSRGNIKAAEKILWLRLQKERPLTDGVDILKNAIDTYYESLYAFERNRWDDSLTLIQQAMKAVPTVPQFIKHYTMLLNTNGDMVEQQVIKNT